MITRRFYLAGAVCVISVLLWLAACGRQGASKAPAANSVEIATASGVAMVLLPGGAFTMGSTDGSADEQPCHEVTLSPFALDKFEVTQDQFAAFQLPDPSHFKGERRPVEQVRWSDAALFCNERSKHEGLEPCYDELTFACNFAANGYRLPTEAEWEYAARAGAKTAYSFGNTPGDLRLYACYEANATEKTDPAGKKKPNPWGFCDLYGNVLEWCNDVYGETYYGESPKTDPRGPEPAVSGADQKRVMRGGAWNSSAEACRATTRYAELPGIADACFARDTFGFRCARSLTPEELAKVQN